MNKIFPGIVLMLAMPLFAQNTSVTESVTIDTTIKITTVPPRFDRGEQSLSEYIQEFIYFPEVVPGWEWEPSGTVYVQFVVDAAGLTRDVTIIDGAGPELDNAVLNVFCCMPRWIPAERAGKKVSTTWIVPIYCKQI